MSTLVNKEREIKSLKVDITRMSTLSRGSDGDYSQTKFMMTRSNTMRKNRSLAELEGFVDVDDSIDL